MPYGRVPIVMRRELVVFHFTQPYYAKENFNREETEGGKSQRSRHRHCSDRDAGLCTGRQRHGLQPMLRYERLSKYSMFVINCGLFLTI